MFIFIILQCLKIADYHIKVYFTSKTPALNHNVIKIKGNFLRRTDTFACFKL